MKEQQQNHFVFEVKDRYKTLGKALTYIWRNQGKMFYEADLYEEKDIDLIANAFSSSLQKGENIRAYFINGEHSKGMYITESGVKHIPTNEYYSKYHLEGEWTYQEAMNSNYNHHVE